MANQIDSEHECAHVAITSARDATRRDATKCLLLLPVLLGVRSAFAQPGNAVARFVGNLEVKFSGTEPSTVKLLRPFEFDDANGIAWPVPAGAESDGASIPQAFWSYIGGPFEGKYLNASVIHDWYCDRRTRPWQDVHRMFYAAMIVSGVEPLKAKVMFAAVWVFGPRWNRLTINNSTFPRAAASKFETNVLRSGGLLNLRTEAIANASAGLSEEASSTSAVWATGPDSIPIVSSGNAITRASSSAQIADMSGRVRATIIPQKGSAMSVLQVEEIASASPTQVTKLVAWASEQSSIAAIEAGAAEAVAEP